MNEFLIYGISALLICFTLSTFLLSKIDAEVIPENYEFLLDPFWYVWGMMFAGGVISFSIFPQLQDMIKIYGYFDIIAPFVFASGIYFCYLFDLKWLAHLVTFVSALFISNMTPETFQLFPLQLSPWQDKLVVAFIIFAISCGMGLLNGLAAIASLQFLTVMFLTILLAYFGIIPQILGILALTYAGVMLAFAFFSWPPEKLYLSNGAFVSIGFILGCFMLNGAVEYVESSMFIAVSYLFTEMGIVWYQKFIYRRTRDFDYMHTAYFRISEDGQYERGIVRGVMKILFIDIVLAIIQIASTERLAFPVFAVALNMWFLSILSGDTNPEELLSISRWGKNAIKSAWAKKRNKKKGRKK